MTGYERLCRRLLVAFPPEFRRERGEDLIATLLDEAREGEVRMPLLTVLDLIVSGARMRAVRAGAARTAWSGAAEGMAIAAVVSLALQSALAVASAVYKAEHGVVFYLPAGGPYTAGHDPLGAQSLLTWDLLGAMSAAALTAAVRGAWRAAGAMSLVVTAYLSIVAVAFSTGAFSPRPLGPDVLAATPGFLAVPALSFALATGTAIRSRSRPPIKRTPWWLAAAGALAAVFVLVGDGNAARGSATHLVTAYPPQGGIMTALQILVVVAMVTGLVWSGLDPRVGWAVAFLAVPFVVHQVSDLTLGRYYYGYLYQPGWQTALPLILASAAITAMVTSAILASRRLRRL